MSFTSRLLSWWMRLPPAETHDIVIRRDVQVAMPDGVVLLADHYAPRSGPKRPTILVRSPYGRRGFFGATFALPYAERGYQVFMQSCRGTAGSGGEFVYTRNEHDDGLATIAWIKQQEWFSGELAMVGGSYLGFVQWAVAAEAGPELKALVPSITTSDFNHFRFQGGFTLESSLGWSTMMTQQAATGLRLSSVFSAGQQQRRLARAFNHLPLNEADRVAINQPSRHYQNVLAHGPEDDYWKPIDFSARVGEVTAPIYLQGGWYDLFLDWQLKDYQALRAAGRQPYLLIGPWAHGDLPSTPVTTRETLAWLRAQLQGDQSGLREKPVRLLIMGSNEWRDFADWPPPARQERWHLQPGGALAPVSPPDSEPDRYRYDPADPTPAVGGNSLGDRKHMGPKDNRKLEARPDVLVYTSAPLEQDMEVIGPVTADLYVRSSLEHTDFFARLCVVEPSGKSINLCDGIVRLTPDSLAPEADGSWHLQIALWPTAYHFRRGQRVCVQVSSGAHPRFARNLGTGEPIATATKLLAADQMVYHDPQHPSAILLPVLSQDAGG
jgi:putative CocE/NonD family hydrolase